MASSITSTTIDAAFPVAGVDNDTQGFRDNFSIIKTNFAYAATEITDLQNNVARLDQTSDFQGSNILDAQLVQCTESFLAVGTVLSGMNISFLNGRYQSITVSLGTETSSIGFTLTDWPSTEVENRLAKITVELKCADAVAKTVTFATEGGIIKKSSNWPATLLVDGTTNPVIVDFWSYDQGITVYAEYKGIFV
jgi:flagellin-like hook-associated protein FlgL